MLQAGPPMYPGETSSTAWPEASQTGIYISNRPNALDSGEDGQESPPCSGLALVPETNITQEPEKHSLSVGYPLADAGSLELHLLHLLLDKQDFVSHIVIGPSFADEVQKKLRNRFLKCPNVLGEAYLATSGGFLRSQYRCRPDALDLSRAASALQKLRNIRITDCEEIPIVLSLGLCLLTFGLFLSTGLTNLICRHTLSLIKPWYSSIIGDVELEFEMLCLIQLDTTDCLIRRQVPVLKYVVQDESRVDRYTGLCSTLLPILYEVCELGYLSRQTRFEDTSLDSSRFAYLEREVQNWRPSPPSHFLDRFSSHEVILMLTQAKVLQAATLLIIHRLQFPFGTDDHIAKLRAQYIFSELDLCKALTDRSPKTTLLGFLVAALEIDGSDHRRRLIHALRSGENGVYYVVDSNLADFIELVWKGRDKGSNGSFFDLLDSHPSLTVRP
jgi:hypothetical protein